MAPADVPALRQLAAPTAASAAASGTAAVSTSCLLPLPRASCLLPELTCLCLSLRVVWTPLPPSPHPSSITGIHRPTRHLIG